MIVEQVVQIGIYSQLVFTNDLYDTGKTFVKIRTYIDRFSIAGITVHWYQEDLFIILFIHLLVLLRSLLMGAGCTFVSGSVVTGCKPSFCTPSTISDIIRSSSICGLIFFFVFVHICYTCIIFKNSVIN